MKPCAGRNCGSTDPNLHSAECFEDYEKSTGMNDFRPDLEPDWDALQAFDARHAEYTTLLRQLLEGLVEHEAQRADLLRQALRNAIKERLK